MQTWVWFGFGLGADRLEGLKESCSVEARQIGVLEIEIIHFWIVPPPQEEVSIVAIL